ncbi:MAG: cyanoexosortase A [Calothrix sp. MO_167.B12]|nr:cyanoexosortase A [Calothrix sp. MO_167.B12]
MNLSHLEILKYAYNSKFWLVAIASGLIAIQMELTWRIIGNIDTLLIRLIFLISLSYLVWKRREQLQFNSDIISSLCGAIIIIFTTYKSISLFWFESHFIKFYALTSLLGWALIASGIQGLKQYMKEFLIILLLLSEGFIISSISKINFSILGAKFSTFLLWYLGFDVHRQGINVILPTGYIEIYPGCSGLNAMFLLLQLALLFILIFPINPINKIILPVVAVLLAFIINGFRLALMALLVAASNYQAFTYWHGQPGTEIFSTLSILSFGLFCHFILKQCQSKPINLLEHKG